MIEIEIRRLGDHEILHAMPTGKRDKLLPVVVFYHGFTSSKLVYSYFAVALAQAGFRVVMPDAPDHGARFTGDEQARLGQFWPILHGSLTEFSGMRDALYDAGLVADNRLAVAGASMGGMTARLADWEVTRALPRVADRPLLLWHGDADDVVPPDGTFRLQQALKREGLDGNLTCLWESGVRHRITPAALEATVAFFRQHL